MEPFPFLFFSSSSSSLTFSQQFWRFCFHKKAHIFHIYNPWQDLQLKIIQLKDIKVA